MVKRNGILIQKTRFVIFGILFVALLVVVYGLLSYEKNSKIQEYLESKTQRYVRDYNVVYENYKKLSEIIYKTRINTKNVIDIFKDAAVSTKDQKDLIRTNLYDQLKDTYELLKKYNIKQLHFHLPNNESFLRFHRPAKFGDNLTNIRGTVKYVNKTNKPVHGFEEGRIYNGYRFVFPLSYQNQNIGSVEVSFSTFAMSMEFMNNYDVTAPFLILKDKVDEKVFKSEKSNYVKSPLHNFYIEKKMIENIKNIKIKQPVSQKTANILNKKALDDNSFSLYDNKRDEIMTFIKVKNPISEKVVGIFVVRSSSVYIFNKTKSFYISFAFATLFIAVLLFLIYKELVYRVKIEQKVNEEVEKNKKTQEQLFKSEKMASMGEMIGNIAHQWRQPLSVISTSATGLKLQKEHDILSDEFLLETCDMINKNAQYLSKTIDEFRNFIKSDQDEEIFNLKTDLDRFLKLIEGTIRDHNINMNLDIDKSINIKGHSNELIQCLINMFNNSKEVFENIDETDRLIFISGKISDDDIVIRFKDSGGGIEDEIVSKIFEPYFTTKHQSQGTGLGLHMTYNLITQSMGGTIEAVNTTYEYDGKAYTGAEFIIVLPRR